MEDMKKNDELVESYIQQLRDFDYRYRKLERKYNRMQMKNQDLIWTIRKMNRLITRLRGAKESFVNVPKRVRRGKK